MDISQGTQLGRYEIRSKLGAGGMGEVYLAWDSQLDRTVALKVLHADVAQDNQRMRRFRQEAKAASALNHPYILTIYEIGEADSTHFIATEFIKGETLRERMQRTGLPMSEVLGIAIQIADALAAAHAAGIVHRDIKPENIMVREDGYVKILDFGLAKLVEQTSSLSTDTEAPTKVLVNTEPGVVMGTTQYMSPEQARGAEVDERTDIWALGVMLYEMITGVAPFKGKTVSDTIASILKTEPQPLSDFEPEAPPEIERIVSKALEKEADDRYQTIKDLLVDLRRLKKRIDFEAELGRSLSLRDKEQNPVLQKSQPEQTIANIAPKTAERSTSSAEYIVDSIRRHKLSFGVASLAVLLAAIGLIYWLTKGRQSTATTTSSSIESIAVMPFINASGNPDVEYLSDGITESLINNLSRLQSLRVIARSTVFSLKGRELQPQQIGKQLNVRAILNGRVVERGDTLTIQVDLVDADTGAEIWGEQYQRKQTDVLQVQEEIARDVTMRLRLKLTGEEQKLLTKRYTNNPEAYEYYLKGRYHFYNFTEAEWHQALDDFKQAILKDPNYALAYTGIADCYGFASAWLMPPTEAYPKLQEAALKALQIDSTLAEAWAELAGYKLFYEHDWADAEREMKHALELNPDSTDARLYYSFILYASGRTDECLALLKQSLQSDPLSLPVNTNLAEAYYYARRYDETLDIARKMLEINRDAVFGRIFAGWAYEQKGQYDAAIAEFEQAKQLENIWATAALGNVYGVAGRKDEALHALAELQTVAKSRYVSPYFFALIYTGLGDKDQAFAWLNKAYDEHNDYLIYIKVEPLFDSLRSDPRFQDLLRRIGLTE